MEMSSLDPEHSNEEVSRSNFGHPPTHPNQSKAFRPAHLSTFGLCILRNDPTDRNVLDRECQKTIIYTQAGQLGRPKSVPESRLCPQAGQQRPKRSRTRQQRSSDQR